jgi:hypothetical protein
MEEGGHRTTLYYLRPYPAQLEWEEGRGRLGTVWDSLNLLIFEHFGETHQTVFLSVPNESYKFARRTAGPWGVTYLSLWPLARPFPKPDS